jgi:hypothetical protein
MLTMVKKRHCTLPLTCFISSHPARLVGRCPLTSMPVGPPRPLPLPPPASLPPFAAAARTMMAAECRGRAGVHRFTGRAACRDCCLVLLPVLLCEIKDVIRKRVRVHT